MSSFDDSTVPTVLLSQRFSTDSQAVWNAANRAGWGIHRAIRYLPPDPLPDRVCAYGEVSFCDIMADRAGLGLLDPPNDWLPRLPYDVVKRDIAFCQAGRLHLFGRRSFFKPSNDKVFSAGVYERGSDVPLKYVDPGCPCLVSEVVAFDVEYRCVVLDGLITRMEYYRMVGIADTTEEAVVQSEARAFAEAVVAGHSHELPSAVVVDVGRIEGRGWAVVEANQVHASGIYGEGDVTPVLDATLRSAGPMSAVSERDRPFLRNQ
jgi:ATP-grasp domain, R2K clade family 3